MDEGDLTAAWLSRSCLLLTGTLGGLRPEATLDTEGGASVALEVRHFAFPAPVAGDGAGGVSIVVVPPGGGAAPGRSLTLRAGGGSLTLAGPDLERTSVEVATMVRRHLAPLDASTRSQLLEFLAATLGAVPEAELHDLSERLYGIGQALRERLPAVTVGETRPRGLHIDRMMAVDERSFFVEGRLHVDQTGWRRLTAVSPEGARVELLDRMARSARPAMSEDPDVDAYRRREGTGFLCFFELGAPSVRREGWVIEVEDARGERLEIAVPEVISEALDVREAILDDPHVKKLPDEELMRDHIYPAISRIQERLAAAPRFESVVQHGTPPEAPDVTIVVPLYRHVEHAEVQLSQFADDPDVAQAELIYVLDSPEDAGHLRRHAAELYPIYRLPFRVATLAANIGFAGASNAGASLARGRLLLLLNSDVLPAEPGWLSRMRDFYDATPNIGALGPKLLYEDDSIQHAGMHFIPFPDPGLRLWVDSTYFKGMHTSLPAANIARPVPAVSGACMMIDRRLWEEVGGLQRIYVRGDYEDSHMCMELLERGRENWYLPDAVLYHLEGQSYTSKVRGPSNRFNSWVYARLWGDRIESIVSRVPDLPAA